VTVRDRRHTVANGRSEVLDRLLFRALRLPGEDEYELSQLHQLPVGISKRDA
jgi:hypothetical protein